MPARVLGWTLDRAAWPIKSNERQTRAVRELAAEFTARATARMVRGALRKRDDAGSPVGDRSRTPAAGVLEEHRSKRGKRALVIGSGLGDDAEQLAAWGFKTTAFRHIEDGHRRRRRSATRRRTLTTSSPISSIRPRAGCARSISCWRFTPCRRFTGELRPGAIEKIAEFVAPGGHLLVIARGRADDEPEGQGPPWPLTRDEIDGFRRAGLEEESFEDYAEPEPPWVRRFRALYRRR